MLVTILFRNFCLFWILVIFYTSQTSAEIYPVEAWAKRPNIANVALSPDGETLALLRIKSTGENPQIEIYKAETLEKIGQMDADPMEITRFYWVTDDRIFFRARQKVRDKIDGYNQGVYENSSGIITLDGKNSTVKKLGPELGGGLASALPKYPNKVILSAGRRPTKYYLYDIETKRKKLITRESEEKYGFDFDEDGNPMTARGYDGVTNEFVSYYRPIGSTEWDVVNKTHRESFESWSIAGRDPLNPKDLLVVAHNGNDKLGLWVFDPQEKKHKELIYRRNDVDIVGVRFHTNYRKHPDLITGVRYYQGNEEKIEWFDGEEKALYDQLKALIPHAGRFFINTRSVDGNSLVVENYSPRDPGTFYLLKNGEFKVIGSTKPQLASDALADVKAITYKARDGKTIHGSITIPNRPPPYPLVVMLHGGPFVPEKVFYDEWGQLLANNGYLVLQPSYRGTEGYGLDFYQTAFINGGQGGYQMQDDKDDGALFLVEEGLADPDRMMMFGWSYGGYAALVAAARDPQIYQCVIAGASVPDPNEQVNYSRNRMNAFVTRTSIEQIKMWDNSVSPIDEVENVNIPMLLIHGDVDQRTPARAVRRYIKQLEKHDKVFDQVWLKGADHFSNTLFFDHKVKFYTAMIDYLKNDCFKNSNKIAQR